MPADAFDVEQNPIRVHGSHIDWRGYLTVKDLTAIELQANDIKIDTKGGRVVLRTDTRLVTFSDPDGSLDFTMKLPGTDNDYSSLRTKLAAVEFPVTCIDRLNAAEQSADAPVVHVDEAPIDAITQQEIQSGSVAYRVNGNNSSLFGALGLRAWFHIACKDPMTNMAITSVEKVLVSVTPKKLSPKKRSPRSPKKRSPRSPKKRSPRKGPKQSARRRAVR